MQGALEEQEVGFSFGETFLEMIFLDSAPMSALALKCMNGDMKKLLQASSGEST